MVLWHTADGWLLPDQRQGQVWQALRFVGGLAAPSFLFLAGCAAAIAARSFSHPDQANKALRASAGRALEVLWLGYALRFQSWMVDASAVTQLGLLPAWLPLGLGYLALWWSAGKLAEAPRRALAISLLGLVLAAAGLWQVHTFAPTRFARLLQVDVLQAIGASLCLLALAQRGFSLLSRPGWLFALSAMVAASTLPLSTLLPGPLPGPLVAYLVRLKAIPGGPPPALFPLFPWFAYPLAGAGVGALLKRAEQGRERLIIGAAALGAVVALLTSEAQPFVHRLISAQPWIVYPVRVGFRIGIVLVLLLVGWVWAHRMRGRVLVDFGQSSLRIYWAHMFFAYGVLGRALQHRVSFVTWGLWLLPLFLGMWLLTRVGTARVGPAARMAST
jgi:hypothetical protein